ncbi:restriction endonuclease subunit S [Segatella copri]|uniref:Restriction endonuclease subunit S n=1 Tax=Segatella copri TaxID=165179 RepID=A0AAW5V010_9BACT|nr:restriction endonuclease subunit S [Segatella copri]MCW4141764.1 restriction endonuclease subunit S [Segatella copri]MCW4145698.1 restriction endonuclease subunit S [Segatella copri]MCW4166044.1 restriction endonuclease subunit S [Segatella copri]
MRKGWEYKKLGEVCDVINGLWIGKKEPFINVAVIRNTNFSKDCQLNLDKVAFIDVEVKQFASKKLKFGDIIIEKSGGSEKQPVGRPILFNISDGNYSFSNFTSTLRIKDNTEVNSAYLHKCLYAFYLKGETIKLQSKTTGLHNLNIKGYLRLNIPLPPLSTQLAIVSELDKINKLIRLKKEQLKDFDNLAQSLFYEMFGDPVENEKGWEVKKLNEIVSDNCSISYGIVQPGDGVENGVPVVRPVDMTKTFVSRKGLKNTTKEISDSYKRTILKGNEILMCVRGTTGLISMATPELQGCNVTRGIAPIECGPTCDKWFVFYQILNPAIQHHIAEYTRGIALKQINMKDVRDIPLCLPPLSLQRLFAQRIEQIEREKSEVQKSIQDLETLLASRMQYWFE